ncbi:hypothetical protein H0E87_007746, partial [Populus deltoides]
LVKDGMGWDDFAFDNGYGYGYEPMLLCELEGNHCVKCRSRPFGRLQFGFEKVLAWLGGANSP